MERDNKNKTTETPAAKDVKPRYETPMVMSLGGISIGLGKQGACAKGAAAEQSCNPGGNAAGTQCNVGTNALGDKCHTGITAAGGECNGGSTAGTTCGAGTTANLS